MARGLGRPRCPRIPPPTPTPSPLPQTGNDSLPRGGYPDTGNGRFAALLSYDDWYKVNCGQRAHYNYVENFPIYIALGLTAGLMYPRAAAAGLALVVVGRELSAGGYASSGPAGRMNGAPLHYTGLLTLLGCAVATGWTMVGGVKGFASLLNGVV